MNRARPIDRHNSFPAEHGRLMIGVIAPPKQSRVVEEFFQLFKTPWEFYREGRAYDVLISTDREVAGASARLFLIYGGDLTSLDVQMKVAISSKHSSGNLDFQGIQVPIYEGLSVFSEAAGSEGCLPADAGMAGLRFRSRDRQVLRFGYDLFKETEFLLTAGQPANLAHIPTLEVHIQMLRTWILEAGLPLLEIPPTPSGHPFFTCLTHDIDFAGIKYHKLDHTVLGFLYRATIGALGRWIKGGIRFGQLLRNWRAALSLPFVYAGWARDFWIPFDWYLNVEKDLGTTYFLIPFKGRAGENLPVGHANKRAAAYDIADIPEWAGVLTRKGCEIGVHGIDAWHDVQKGREELKRIASITGEPQVGIRMHWLLSKEDSARTLEEAGYAYDSSSGYNESVGYRCGTTQVFRPPGAKRLLELPMHVQDGALFFPNRLGLSEPEAWQRCGALLENTKKYGGVLTLIWHDRSPQPERFWGGFYTKLLSELKSRGARFGTCLQVVDWFRRRRNVVFKPVEVSGQTRRMTLGYSGGRIEPPLILRIHLAKDVVSDENEQVDNPPVIDISWSGESDVDLDDSFTLVPRA